MFCKLFIMLLKSVIIDQNKLEAITTSITSMLDFIFNLYIHHLRKFVNGHIDDTQTCKKFFSQ